MNIMSIYIIPAILILTVTSFFLWIVASKIISYVRIRSYKKYVERRKNEHWYIFLDNVFICIYNHGVANKDTNYRSGYKDGYNAGISSHFHEGFSKIINDK